MTGEPTLPWPTSSSNPDIAVNVLTVQPSTHTPDIYKDSDSVSTFNPTPLARKVRRNNTTSTSSMSSYKPSDANDLAPHTGNTQPTATPPTITFHIPPIIRSPTYAIGGSPEGSISRISDTASRLSTFETRFDSITQSLSSSLQLLQDQSLQQAQAQKEFFYLMTQLITPSAPKACDLQTPTGMPYLIGRF
jgi:hypothetical protein